MFHLDLRMDIVEISRCLEWTVAEPDEGLVSVSRSVLHQIPAGRFWAEPGTKEERDSGDEGRPELQSPGDGARVYDSKVGTSSQENTKRSPYIQLAD